MVPLKTQDILTRELSNFTLYEQTQPLEVLQGNCYADFYVTAPFVLQQLILNRDNPVNLAGVMQYFHSKASSKKHPIIYKDKMPSLLREFVNSDVDLIQELKSQDWVRQKDEIGFDFNFQTIFSRLLSKSGILIVQLKLFLNLMLKEVEPTKQMNIIMHQILPILVSSDYHFTELEDYFVDLPENVEDASHHLKFMDNIKSPYVPNFYDEDLSLENMATADIPDHDLVSLAEEKIKHKFLNN